MQSVLKFLCAAALTCGTFHAQTILPPGTIDGAITPDLIPDVVAFRLYFAALSEPKAKPTDAVDSVLPTEKQRAKMHAIQITDDDEAILVETVSNFASTTTNASTRFKQKHSLDEVAQDSVSILRNKMSPEGFQRLLDYVRSQKAYMKIIPFPAMGTH